MNISWKSVYFYFPHIYHAAGYKNVTLSGVLYIPIYNIHTLHTHKYTCILRSIRWCGDRVFVIIVMPNEKKMWG